MSQFTVMAHLQDHLPSQVNEKQSGVITETTGEQNTYLLTSSKAVRISLGMYETLGLYIH